MNEDQTNRVKSRRRVPGLAPIRDSRKRKIPELKEILETKKKNPNFLFFQTKITIFFFRIFFNFARKFQLV